MSARRLFKFCFLLLLISGCSKDNSQHLNSTKNAPVTKKTTVIKAPAYPSEHNPKFNISFKKNLVIKTSYSLNSHLHGIWGSIEVDSLSRIYALSGHQVQVFDKDGLYVTTLGREGRGPGELSFIVTPTLKIKDMKLYVRDDILQRINIYDLNFLKHSNTILLEPQEWNHISQIRASELYKYYLLADSLFLVAFRDTRLYKHNKKNMVKYYLINYNGKIVSDMLFEYPYNSVDGTGRLAYILLRPDAIFPNASTRTTLVAVDQQGNVYTIWTGDIRIKIHNIKTKTHYTIYYPFKNRPLNASIIINSYKSQPRVYQRAKQMDYPKNWPAVQQFFVDDQQRIWIATITDDKNNYHWLILNKKGALLAKFKWAGQRLKSTYKRRQIRLVKNNHLYTIQRSKKTGIKMIVRYKIDFKPFNNLAKE